MKKIAFRQAAKLPFVGIVLCAATARPHARKAQPLPRWVRLSISGYRLSLAGVERNQLFYDRATQYAVESSATGCGDTTDAQLNLVPATPRMLASREDKPAFHYVKLPRLWSGTGVNLGDSSGRVIRKLGSPPHPAPHDSITETYAPAMLKGDTRLVYRATISLASVQGHRARQGEYMATYIFRSGRLRSIHYNIQEGEEC